MASEQPNNDDFPRQPADILSSSPQRPSSSVHSKERRHPSITPRKFRRFFTPRPPLSNTDTLRSTSSKLRALGTQRRALSSPITFGSWSDENSPPNVPRGPKRQKLSHNTPSNPGKSAFNATPRCSDSKPAQPLDTDNQENYDPVPSSPCPQDPRTTSGQKMREVSYYNDVEEQNEETPDPVRKESPRPIKRVRRYGGLSMQLFERELGLAGRPGRSHQRYPVNDWRDLTANFYSGPEDYHEVESLLEPSRRTIPFVAVGLNNSSLLAVGDEDGQVRLLETAKDGNPSFKKNYLSFRVHTNAVIDMAFSEDDMLLATASGDQSARVVDMSTQTTIAVLGTHTASLKQVRFQPGSNNRNILATSGRDGSIHVWDLRCKGWDGPQTSIWTAIDGKSTGARTTFSDRDVIYSRPSNNILSAHKHIPGQVNPAIGFPDAPNRGEAPSRLDDPGRSNDLSVTSLQFLNPGREHLLLSACEANCSVSLWDIRSLPSKRATLPLAVTALPLSHYGYRNYGITSLDLNSTGSMFYSVCKDNVVYAYRTNHLIMGLAPELDTPSTCRMPRPRPTQEGQGPIYGFVNKRFHANTFYVKSALRTTKNGKSELLAVGSTDGCAVLFPTDERYLPSIKQSHGTMPIQQKEFESKMYGIPIYSIGTSLIRGHDREVGSLSWTHDGELATVADDLTVRCWREDRDIARHLRIGGEGEGRRWGCAWADVNADYDDNDEEY